MMLKNLLNNAKHFVITLWVSMLTLFTSLFVITILIILWLNNAHYTTSIRYIALALMNQTTTMIMNEINNGITLAEKRISATSALINQGIVNVNNISELATYTYILQHESFLPIAQAIVWGDAHGNAVATQALPNGIVTDITTYSPHQTKLTTWYYNQNNQVIKKTHGFSSFDPRQRPWFIEAKKQNKIIWTEPFAYQLSSHRLFGTTAAGPVYNQQHQFMGVFTLGISFEHLVNFISKIKVSKNSIIFITMDNGKVIVYPGINYLHSIKKTLPIRAVAAPWVTASFYKYISSKQATSIFNYQGKRYLAHYQTLPVLFGNHHWLVGIVAPESDFLGTLLAAHMRIILVSICILLVGILLISKLTSRIINPIKVLVAETEKIKNFELASTTPISSRIKEIRLLANAIYTMKQSLRSFQKYVPSSLVRLLIKTGEDARIGGTKKQLAILFSDIRNFTTIAETMDPNSLTEHLCQYFDELTKIIRAERGTIDKYIGDSVMAFWGAPISEPQPAQQAALAALRCKQRLDLLNNTWKNQGKPALFTRFGIHLGEAIIGNIGAVERLNYTAIGDTVNIASRLEGINKIYGTQIIVSESVYKAIKNNFILRKLDNIIVKGKSEPTTIYELLTANAAELSFDIATYLRVFDKGFSYYQQKSWDAAITEFTLCLQLYPEDTLAPLFIKRCEHFKSHPPNMSWQGVWHIDEK
ncbi:MAG: hypothetical protein A3E83_03355 [Gammaproteobacteria bacterium RIFCSPHIGHO2_12_FULL_41_20]|nr:MAG: hypothetical protein A3E83_03355 [Gammaproteobacteria bacterium RIFCSPHIGHO2_12_FULL_41_20]